MYHTLYGYLTLNDRKDREKIVVVVRRIETGNGETQRDIWTVPTVSVTTKEVWTGSSHRNTMLDSVSLRERTVVLGSLFPVYLTSTNLS